MFEFITGYIIGSSSAVQSRISLKHVAVVLLIAMFMGGIGYVLFSHALSLGKHECFGNAIGVAMCEAGQTLQKLALLSVGLCAAVAVLWLALSTLLSGMSDEGDQ